MAFDLMKELFDLIISDYQRYKGKMGGGKNGSFLPPFWSEPLF